MDYDQIDYDSYALVSKNLTVFHPGLGFVVNSNFMVAKSCLNSKLIYGLQFTEKEVFGL